MGNSSSGHVGASHPPPPWTQSLPRDVHRLKKYGGLQGTKVLPERIPGQRLRPTENGHNLQFQGTITNRRVSDGLSHSPEYTPLLGNQHSSSTTALNHSANTAYYQHDLRFGSPPSKSFISEPDLRGASPTSHTSLPITRKPTVIHTIISESPTKGKIKSKKRHKAPLPPPPLQTSISLPLEAHHYIPSSPNGVDNWSSASPAPSDNSKVKSKPRKIGLFKKRSESRLLSHETEPTAFEHRSRKEERLLSDNRLIINKERSTTPVPIQVSSKKELKEKARSLDNLQHEIRRSPLDINSSLHSLEVIGSIPPEDGRQWHEKKSAYSRRHESPENVRRSAIDREIHSQLPESRDKMRSSTLDRESRSHRRLSTVERRLHEKQLGDKKLERQVSSPVGEGKTKAIRSRSTEYYRSSSSSGSGMEVTGPKDEWDEAEEEWLQRKKISEDLQKEIINAAKNLKKTSVSSDLPLERNAVRKDKVEIPLIASPTENEVKEEANEEIPKTFFFGMEPEEIDMQNDAAKTNSALTKLNEQEVINIVGSTVEYSRHSLNLKDKKRNLERNCWNQSLDYREIARSRSRSRERGLDDNVNKQETNKNISRKINEFAATIERSKSHRISSSEELSSSISRKGDGGYHSRQNSGSFHLDTEASDDDNVIRMNLRPTLPRRQLELPRFSPNAAWRSLSVETANRQKEVFNEVLINEESYNVSEDKIHRYTRPTAPPRGSGEKSADSGISGDAGSPGPMQEFEPLTPEKIKSSSGPLAVSSPVASAKLDIKRTWTPAQDLDDNSFDENVDQNGKTSIHHEVSTLPRLTSRSNMFTPKPRNELIDDVCFEGNQEYEKRGNSPKDNSFETQYKINDISFKNKIKSEEQLLKTNSLQRTKPLTAYPSYEQKVKDAEVENQHEDSWRENWSMSRSIPNSLNTCDEPDCNSTSSKQCRSRSESRMSGNNNLADNRGLTPTGISITPAYLQNRNSGHIMYLPEYKSCHIDKNKNFEKKKLLEHHHQVAMSNYYNEYPPGPEKQRTSPYGDENPDDPESSRWSKPNINIMSPEIGLQRDMRVYAPNSKKSKKFSYQSTVRIMEKKKLEEQLTKEVEEKEKSRLQEIEAMLKVEEEFQMKREREKKRLKKQLKVFQKKHGSQRTDPNMSSSSDDKTFLTHSSEFSPNERLETLSEFSDRIPPPLPSSPTPPFVGHRQLSSYQSLPMELVGNTPVYENTFVHPYQSGLLSGLKKWVKGKKDSRSGYQSDASSVTVTSGSRQEPDGAPASSPCRKNVDNIRAEIITASRHRNGTPILERDQSSHFRRNRSPAASVASKDSHRRTFTPDSKRTISPDSRKSLSSETCQLTQELPEMRQEQRQYREYRRSGRKMLMPIVGPIRTSQKVSPASHNYRRDFCMGNLSNSPAKAYHQDDIDRFSRHSNESRKSKESLLSSKRCSSAELVDSEFTSNNPSRRSFVGSHEIKSPVPISLPFKVNRGLDPLPVRKREVNLARGNPSFKEESSSSQSRYSQNIISPFNPSKGYRPVSFSPQPGKILTVT